MVLPGVKYFLGKQEKVYLKEELFYLTIRDSLTGFFNRRPFFNTLQLEKERAKRQNRALCLILIDIDYFKQYNDTFGHLEGDKALEMLARILKSSLRQSVDSIYRYGGDEFASFLIETTIQQAIQIAERIRISYEKEKLGSTTLSLGISEYKPHFDVETFIGVTDTAMYETKGSGGNQVILYGSTKEPLRNSGMVPKGNRG
jgi:diguanylate cyclase (GGDEF)-like protein